MKNFPRSATEGLSLIRSYPQHSELFRDNSKREWYYKVIPSGAGRFCGGSNHTGKKLLQNSRKIALRAANREIGRLVSGLILLLAGASGALGQEPTFSEDVAPILWKNCAECHREGQSAPFALVNFEDARKHASQILELVSAGEMPPWLPGDRGLQMVGERGLSVAEIETLRQWVEGDRSEGESLPDELLPTFEGDEWQLGEPDLILELDEPWTLEAEGKDVFRNFVISNPLDEKRFVRAVEYRIGNARVVHHAIVQIDETGSCRELDAADQESGFPGMGMGDSEPPDGYFLGWSPGKSPSISAKRMAWTLNPGVDFVMQMHLLPSGKREEVAPKVGLYFTEEAPIARPLAFYLRDAYIDIPAGESSYRVRQEFELPCEVAVLAFYPHAHYVCRSMSVAVRYPDGSNAMLLDIPQWDFDWQDLYTLEKPAILPAGARILMEYVYDNSDANSDNPYSPPRRTQVGNGSYDEMGTLWVQVLPLSPKGYAEFPMAQNRYAAESRPSTRNFYNYGRDLQMKRQVEEAIEYYQKAIDLGPEHSRSHFQLSLAYLEKGINVKAFDSIVEAVRLDPGNAKYRFKLGELHAARAEFSEAQAAFAEVLRLSPNYPRAEEFRAASEGLAKNGGNKNPK